MQGGHQACRARLGRCGGGRQGLIEARSSWMQQRRVAACRAVQVWAWAMDMKTNGEGGRAMQHKWGP